MNFKRGDIVLLGPIDTMFSQKHIIRLVLKECDTKGLILLSFIDCDEKTANSQHAETMYILLSSVFRDEI